MKCINYEQSYLRCFAQYVRVCDSSSDPASHPPLCRPSPNCFVVPRRRQCRWSGWRRSQSSRRPGPRPRTPPCCPRRLAYSVSVLIDGLLVEGIYSGRVGRSPHGRDLLGHHFDPGQGPAGEDRGSCITVLMFLAPSSLCRACRPPFPSSCHRPLTVRPTPAAGGWGCRPGPGARLRFPTGSGRVPRGSARPAP